jgi:ankyrin repeat protein
MTLFRQSQLASTVLLHLGQTEGLLEAVNALNDDGDTPLTLACAYGHSTVAELLLEMVGTGHVAF